MTVQAETGLTTTYRVRFDESGPDGRLPASGFLRYAQDMAWRHSAARGFDREWYAGRGLAWLIRAVELDIVGFVEHGQEVHVSTEVLGFRRAWARRRSEFRGAPQERPLAVALIDWVLLNAAGRPVRAPDDILHGFPGVAEGTFSPLRVPLPPAPGDALHSDFRVRRRELDPMAHVNNAAYLDYIDEQLEFAGFTGRAAPLPRRYRVEYIAPARARQQLSASTWPAEAAWCLRVESADGKEILRARVETDPGDWVGG